ncbi:hypothetical protein [Dactylosporangium sp. CA-139066]|uniref:hypothetical protein n=1 Tax=Dactylosporangium sp. CA-139066 TaxID=3239930 RepID=UPI003D8BA805
MSNILAKIGATNRTEADHSSPRHKGIEPRRVVLATRAEDDRRIVGSFIDGAVQRLVGT